MQEWRTLSTTATGDELLGRAMELAAAGQRDVEALLELTGRNSGLAHQARGRCLAMLQARPTERRTLLQALELIDCTLDQLEAG
jgi:hypothetical protein